MSFFGDIHAANIWPSIRCCQIGSGMRRLGLFFWLSNNDRLNFWRNRARYMAINMGISFVEPLLFDSYFVMLRPWFTLIKQRLHFRGQVVIFQQIMYYNCIMCPSSAKYQQPITKMKYFISNLNVLPFQDQDCIAEKLGFPSPWKWGKDLFGSATWSTTL